MDTDNVAHETFKNVSKYNYYNYLSRESNQFYLFRIPLYAQSWRLAFVSIEIIPFWVARVSKKKIFFFINKKIIYVINFTNVRNKLSIKVVNISNLGTINKISYITKL